MIVVSFVDCLALLRLKNMYVSSTFIFGFGLVLIRKKIDLFSLWDCWIFSGEKISWLMALLRNRIFVGLIKIDVSGSMLWIIMKLTFVVSILDRVLIIGLMSRNVRIARIISMMFAEKLFISILKSDLILSFI